MNESDTPHDVCGTLLRVMETGRSIKGKEMATFWISVDRWTAGR